MFGLGFLSRSPLRTIARSVAYMELNRIRYGRKALSGKPLFKVHPDDVGYREGCYGGGSAAAVTPAIKRPQPTREQTLRLPLHDKPAAQRAASIARTTRDSRQWDEIVAARSAAKASRPAAVSRTGGLRGSSATRRKSGHW